MADKNSLYGIYDVWHVPFWQTPLFYFAMSMIGILLGLSVLIIIFRWYRKRRQKKIPAWEKALNAFEQLKKQECETAAHGKLLYCTITDILKDYFHKRYSYQVHGKTDDELVVYLQEKECDADVLAHLEDIAQGGIMVKFANVQAMRDEILRHLDVACLIVKKTIPKEE